MSLSALRWDHAAVVLAGVLPGDWLLYTLYVKWSHVAAVWGGSCGNSALVCFVVGCCRGEAAKRLSLVHIALRWMRV